MGMGKRALPWGLALAIAAVLFAANLFLGDLNHDEGWYLYAARLVRGGELPYRDFASTQGPVMPFVYALADPLVDRLGLAGGRLFTACLGFICALAASVLARRAAPSGLESAAGLVAFLLVGVNVYQAYFFTVVKTYALAGLLLVLGFLALDAGLRARGGRGRGAVVLSGILLALAAGTRVSAAITLPAVFVAVLLLGRSAGADGSRAGAARRGSEAFWFALGACAGLCAVFLPFALLAPGGLWFGLVEYHAGRSAGGWFAGLLYKAGFASRMLRAYPVAVGACVGVLVWRLPARRAGRAGREECSAGQLERLLWVCAGLITLVHWAAPVPYDDYQAMVYPLAAAAAAAGVARVAGNGRAGSWAVLCVFLLSVVSAFSSPMNQEWVVSSRDRVWWPVKSETPLGGLRRAARMLRRDLKARPGETILTQDTYLAVEAGMSVPRGLELGPFCYFPDWPRDKAERLRVVNRETMLDLIDRCDARVAAFSGYGLAIACPAVSRVSEPDRIALWDRVLARYSVSAELSEFGQAGTKLVIMERKPEE